MDDFLCIGSEKELKWFRTALREKYDIKSRILNAENKEVTFLGRRVTWKDEGIEIEADPKHVEILLKEWGLLN